MEITIVKLTDDTSRFEMSAADFMAALTKAVDESPEEVRETVFVEMEATTDYECGVSSLTIKRLATDEERAEQEEIDEARRVQWRASEDARLHREFLRLKDKFEGS